MEPVPSPMYVELSSDHFLKKKIRRERFIHQRDASCVMKDE